MKEELQEVVMRNKFGICPVCGNKLLLLKSEFEAYAMGDTAWIQKSLEKRVDYKGICLKCGYKINYELTERGLEPVGFVAKPSQAAILGKRKQVAKMEE